MAKTYIPRDFVTLGMFIIDEFEFLDEAGRPTERKSVSQIGGGGTYAAIGARIWLPPHKLGMIVDRGHDFPPQVQRELESYGPSMWYFRDQPEHLTTRSMNRYLGDHRDFEYLTPRIRITPHDLNDTPLERPTIIHFICSPTRALAIMSEVDEYPDWTPVTIYEPIPNRCVPEELPSLVKVLPHISVLSPNAEEALSLLSMELPPTKQSIENAAHKFLNIGVGQDGKGSVIIRSGELGAYVCSHELDGIWVDAFHQDKNAVVDVTGAGNSFLGGLAAGLLIEQGDVRKATLYATVSASFVIEQGGLPRLSTSSATEKDDGVDSETEGLEVWNGDSPYRRLEEMRRRVTSKER